VHEVRHVQEQVLVAVRVLEVAHGQVVLQEQAKAREPEVKRLAVQVHHKIFHRQVQESMGQVAVLLHCRQVRHSAEHLR